MKRIPVLLFLAMTILVFVSYERSTDKIQAPLAQQQKNDKKSETPQETSNINECIPENSSVMHVYAGEMAGATVNIVVSERSDESKIRMVVITGYDYRVAALKVAEHQFKKTDLWKIWCCDDPCANPLEEPEACPIPCEQNETNLIDHAFEKIRKQEYLTKSTVIPDTMEE